MEKQVLEHLNFPLCVWDVQGVIRFHNQKFADMFGYDPEYLNGRSVLTVVDDAHHALLESHMQDVFKDKKYTESYMTSPWHGKHKNGHPLTMRVKAISYDCQDTGDRLRLSTIELVSESANFNQAAQQRQKLEAMGRLAGGVAHEINNMLQPALIFSEYVLSQLDEEQPDMKQAMETVIESMVKASEIVQDVLLFTRDEKPKTELLSVSKAVEQALAFLKGILPNTVKLHLQGLDQISAVEGTHRSDKSFIDKNAVAQIFANLINNAVYAMDGTGDIDIIYEVKDVKGEQAQDIDIVPARYAHIIFKDSGSGMNVETLAALFDPFFTTKPVGEGTGLGMSVVHGLIHGWGGEIKVDSKIGEGTQFDIYIPVTDRASANGGDLTGALLKV